MMSRLLRSLVLDENLGALPQAVMVCAFGAKRIPVTAQAKVSGGGRRESNSSRRERQPAADQGVYSYANKAQYHGRVEYALGTDAVAAEACDLALRVWRGFGCRDAGRVDIRCDGQGRVHFIEVNPLAGLHPVDADLAVLCRLIGVPYQDLIAGILTSALGRQGASETARGAQA